MTQDLENYSKATDNVDVIEKNKNENKNTDSLGVWEMNKDKNKNKELNSRSSLPYNFWKQCSFSVWLFLVISYYFSSLLVPCGQ